MLCRLCVKQSLCFLNIFDSDGLKLDIADMLGRHFWFKPLPDDGMSTTICTMCWSKVYNFHQFYVTIEQAHSVLSASNVEKELIDNDNVVRKELSCSTIEGEKEFVDPEFIEIDVNVKNFPETPCSSVGKRNESLDLEFIKIDVNAEGFLKDPCSNVAEQNHQNDPLPEPVFEIDICDNLNEECDKLNIEDVEDSNSFTDGSIPLCNADPSLLTTKKSTQIVKNRKRLTATEKKIPNLRKKVDAETTRNEKNKIYTDASSSHSDTQKTALLPKKSTEPVKNQKRLTKKKLPKLRAKRVVSRKSNRFTDGTLMNSNAQETALQKPTEPISEASSSYCNPQEPELHKDTVGDVSLSNCDSQAPTPQKSTEPGTDASLSNCDALEPPKKSKKSGKNRNDNKKKLAELKQTRGKTTCNDDELVKKYIPMSCDQCIFVCEDFDILKTHYRADHPNIKPYLKCCNRKLLHWLSIVQHAYKHDDPELFKCQECQKDFNELVTLSRHMTDFHAPEKDKIYSCDFCPKKFAREKMLRIHRNVHIPMNERTFICDKCPNSRFACKDLLRVHITKIHRRPSFVCHVCAKKIKTKAFFEKHVRLHFEESGPKVKCTFEGCDSWLKDEACLCLHIRRYHNKTEEKIFTCEICGGKYKSRASITNHMLRVHPKKTFPCDICNKNFKESSNLREHMAQHTGEKNYKCAFCAYTLNSSGNYYTHLKNMHAVEYENFRKNNIRSNNKILQKLKS